MKRNLVLAMFVLVCALGLPALILGGGAPKPPADDGTTRTSAVANVERAFARWQEGYLAAGGDRSFVIHLGQVEGLFTERGNSAFGASHFDLASGRVQVEIQHLRDPDDSEVWLIDHRSAGSFLPAAGDRMVSLGSLAPREESAVLAAELGSKFFDTFEVEMVVVTRSGADPTEGGLAFGVPSGFQALYNRNRVSWQSRRDERGLTRALGSLLSPRPAFAADPFTTQPLDGIVTQGADLFLNETFNGNGRTCGTCHPPENNFTIDPAFIRTLPDSDALFVAEAGHPNRVAGLEQPTLMRKLGLILENVDGLEDPTQKYAMRGVPHTLALNTSLTKGAECDFGDGFPLEATGWSCDGAPLDGSLNAFAVGAVIQHATRSLNRTPGVDFRLPDSNERLAMEVFQRSLGRQADPDLAAMSFNDPVVEQGRELFTVGAASGCNFCHFNAGATTNGTGGLNRNFNTGVERQRAHPADTIDAAANRDDGGFSGGELATNPCLTQFFDGQASPQAVGIGDCSFNTVPLVEAADTGPFFHNNSVTTLEGAIAFYTSPAFSNTPIALDGSEIDAVGAMLRVLNALENIRNAVQLGRDGRHASLATGRAILKAALSDIEDGRQVLEARSLHFDATPRLHVAASYYFAASIAPHPVIRNAFVDAGVRELCSARNKMAAGSGAPFFDICPGD